ncbi:HDIG domain-containing protein [Mariprofundus aestuarium]|uniref:HDIG domain-containing protein n=1 Tax=Mariprofundus aestuarium TaxID=1921086 RepID=A0A2K8KXC3_MARES|nr:HD domain-containing phosphohydrolase [Mariprofundus aestuarium]ATX79600.1 HDIG domain-containing protein [Mariprofundus aestuarium]
MEGETVREHALHDADVHIEKTISFRKWAAEHGGVYVPATKRTPPNPHLSMIPDRDIETPGGKKLTLMNPSYMTRQLFELEDRVLNVRGHLTSLKPLRPENAADAWETEALKAFERGEKERAELNNIDGEDYMRVMRPLYVEKPCLKCHAQQGYEEGQVRGGISVSLPMAPLIGSAEPVVATMVFSHGLIWFIGLIGLVFSVRTVQGHTVELDNTARLLRESRDQLNRALTNSIQAVEKTVEARDPYTAGHQQRVAELSVLIAQEMGLEKERVDMIYLGASIHDIGKIRVPVEILSKPTRLTEHEYTLIQSHPQSGFDIIEDIDFPVTVKNIVLQHHERVDGLGYPQGLKGDEIDLEARIVAVADILEAMSSDRPYRPGKGMDAALDEVRRQRGVSLDADVVDASLKVVLPLKS